MSKETQNSVLFREQARAWLTLTQPSKDGAPQVFSASGRRVVVADRVDCPDHYRLRETLLVRGDFLCGSGSRFEGPVYVGGDCTIGKGSTFEVLCVEGKLHFSPNTEVKQWVHSFGPMDLRSGTWIAGAATSSHSIQVGVGSGAALLFAPEVASSGRVSMGSDVPPVTTFLEIPAPSSGREPELGGVRGFDIRKLSALGAETWVYDGSLHLSQPVLLGAKLVVRGSFVCPPGSLLEDDLKCGGSLRIGAGTISRGNLISRGEVTLEEECLFSGDIEAGTYLRLCSGVRGFRDAGPVSLVSGDR
ncbi:MAG: hypothetical protein JST16_07630, partial [Bdellovibrionales bacterium]|nr:hypothetical protein [Bdellovibrionales bacterium]